MEPLGDPLDLIHFRRIKNQLTATTIKNNTTNTSSDASKILIKSAPNGHSLVLLRRTRVKGFCVECIKKKSDPNYKKTMAKIITYCPACPGGIWLCEPCFDEKHEGVTGKTATIIGDIE